MRRFSKAAAAVRVRIKICGITREEDALSAAAAGADALGFNFYARSPRCLTAERAARIASVVPAHVTKVAVFVDPAPDAVRRVLDAVPIDLLLFHGDESAAFCEAFAVPYIKVVRVRDRAPEGLAVLHPRACAWLLDTYVPGIEGGTGRTFDWNAWPHDVERRLVLSGGLTPANVADAVVATRPYGVDVAGGVEGEERGVKDAAKVNRFVEEARRAAAQI
jgi:phosphoribosylanthranilate isomerase